MRKLLLLLAVALLASPVLALDYNQNVTPDVIFGSGNANGAFTVDNGTIELGLRGKVRFNASGQPENTFNNYVTNEYYFQAGVGTGQSFPTPTWAFEWTVNTDPTGTSGAKLDAYTYELGLDYDPAPNGTNFVVFDPFAVTASQPYWDHAMGDNTTVNGGGVSATNATEYATYLSQYNVAQQSWRYSWFDAFSTFDPTVVGVYDIYLKAFLNGVEQGYTQIQVYVGATVSNEDAAWGQVKSLYR